ncbi:MAG: DUF1799 domain-containing protein [Zoogloeaceae bacterium]|nr:DUF1799 domain-containing protein [Zoogloeaceae bacterium]
MFLWPDCVPIWGHWQAVQTQWRVGMNGATGLDYAGVMAYLAVVEPDAAARAEAFECIRAAEVATLNARAEKSQFKKSPKA